MEYRVVLPLDAGYPRKARERLGGEARPLYYNGNLDLLNRFTLSVLCSDQSHGTELWETNQILFTIREFDLNFLGSWHSVIETEIFRVGLFKGYHSKKRSSRPLRLGNKTVTLFSAKGLARESYESYLLDRFYPPLHQFPERAEYLRQAEAGELLMLSVAEPDDARQSRPNILARNWMICALGDLLFIPYGPKGTKTYKMAQKAVEAKIPIFTIDHPNSSDLHDLGVPGFNRKTIGVYLESLNAGRGGLHNNEDKVNREFIAPEQPSRFIKDQVQKDLDFKKNAG